MFLFLIFQILHSVESVQLFSKIIPDDSFFSQ